MRRFALAVVVGLLTFSTSGVSGLVINEPCPGFEVPGSDDGACPPACVTCGCCAQAVEPVALIVLADPKIPVGDPPAFLPDRPQASLLDILHVPKPRLS